MINLTWSNHVADADAERDGEVEEGQNFGPGVLDEQVADQGGSNGWVRCLPHANLNNMGYN